VFPPAEDLSSVHLVPEYDHLRRARQGHPRLWLVLHQKNATDLPAPFLEAYRKVGGDSFTGGEPSMNLTVEPYVRSKAEPPGS
jgi:hypothetical protein